MKEEYICMIRILPVLFGTLLGARMSLNTQKSIQDHHQVFTYDLLVTNVCSHANFNRSQSCQQSGFLLSETIKYCGFQSLCEPEYKARCINTLEGGMAHICVPVDLSCEKGVWRKAWIDKKNKNIVKVQEEICPEGRFQPTKSNCFDACRKVHLDLNNLEDWYIVYSTGDNKSPTYVYCNYKKGFYNLSNKTLLNYDQDSAHEIYFCRNKKEINTGCVENKNPLPNGTCVAECASEECRDDHDHFICKRNCSSNIGISESPRDSIKDVRNKSTEIATEENKEPIQTNLKNILLKAIVVIICAFVFIGILFAVIYYHKRHQRIPSNAIEMPSRSRQDLPETESQNNNNDTNKYESQRNKDTLDVTREKETELDHELTRPLLHKQPDTDDQDSLEACASPSNTSKTCIIGDAKSNRGEFKKDTDDTNTQAATNCLNRLLLSCGAIIHMNKVIGSAFRVGPFYVMTAFHVIRHLSQDLTGKTDYDFSRIEREHNLHVNFNGSFIDKHRRDILLKYRYRDEENDCAVLEIKDTDLHQNLPDPLFLWKYDSYHLRINEAILIGYGNKNNPNEKHSDKCIIIGEDTFNTRYREALASLQQNAEVYKNDIQERGFDTSSVDRGYYDVENERLFKFDCFLEKGASGAPVITNEVNSPKLIGLFIGGKPDFFYELSDMQQAAFERKYLFEVGVKISWIYQRMETEDPDLASEIFPAD